MPVSVVVMSNVYANRHPKGSFGMPGKRGGLGRHSILSEDDRKDPPTDL